MKLKVVATLPERPNRKRVLELHRNLAELHQKNGEELKQIEESNKWKEIATDDEASNAPAYLIWFERGSEKNNFLKSCDNVNSRRKSTTRRLKQLKSETL